MRLLITALLAALPAAADPPEIVAATATRSGDGWTFTVTLRHADTGWDDYADGWRVLAPDGKVLGERVLYHPHVEEQTFTRSLTGVAIPDGTPQVRIEARDSVGGWSGITQPLTLR